MIRTTRTKARRKRDLPEFKNWKSQTDRREEKLANLDEIRERRWKTGKRICRICGKPITQRANFTLDHIEPGKMGGCKVDDESNLQDAHYDCNLEKGSRRNFTKQLLEDRR